MSERFYRQQMAHFKVPTQFEFISNFKKPVKANKQDLVSAIIDITNVDCSKMTIPNLQILLSSLMVYNNTGKHNPVKEKMTKLDWQKHLGCYLGVDYNIFAKLTIAKIQELEKALQ